MREILFRGKRVDNGEWVYGDLVRHYENQRAFILAEQLAYTTTECGINRIISERYFEVIHETLGMYTGFQDSKGRRIYDGDILRLAGSYEETDGSMRPYEEIHKIIWLKGCFYAHNEKGFPYWLLLFEVIEGLHDGETYEIVGNIHDEGEDEND